MMNLILILSTILILFIRFHIILANTYIWLHMYLGRGGNKGGGAIAAAAGPQKLVIWLENAKTSENSRFGSSGFTSNSAPVMDHCFLLKEFMLSVELI
jgi:hypothetical protein